MIQVFVRHYLNEEGLHYFDGVWFPSVKKRMTNLPGYIALEASKDLADSTCRCILVQFSDQASLDAWVNHQDHQLVLDDLNVYRVKPWHYYCNESGSSFPPKALSDWGRVDLS